MKPYLDPFSFKYLSSIFKYIKQLASSTDFLPLRLHLPNLWNNEFKSCNSVNKQSKSISSEASTSEVDIQIPSPSNSVFPKSKISFSFSSLSSRIKFECNILILSFKSSSSFNFK